MIRLKLVIIKVGKQLSQQNVNANFKQVKIISLADQGKRRRLHTTNYFLQDQEVPSLLHDKGLRRLSPKIEKEKEIKLKVSEICDQNSLHTCMVN